MINGITMAARHPLGASAPIGFVTAIRLAVAPERLAFAAVNTPRILIKPRENYVAFIRILIIIPGVKPPEIAGQVGVLWGVPLIDLDFCPMAAGQHRDQLKYETEACKRGHAVDAMLERDLLAANNARPAL